MKILVCPQRKGGVGKTMLTRQMAEYLARFKNKRVLVIDLDSQCTLSDLFLNMERAGEHIYPPLHEDYDPNGQEAEEWNGRQSSADLYEGYFGSYRIEKPFPIDNIEIVPGDSEGLARIEGFSRADAKRAVIQLLKENLDELAKRENYDAVLVDTSPTVTHLMLSAIHASTHVLIPIEPAPNCIRGLAQMVGLVNQENQTRHRQHPPTDLVGIVVNKYRKGVGIHDVMVENVKASKSYGNYLLPYMIPQRSAVEELDLSTNSLFDLRDKRAKTMQDTFIKLGEHLFDRMFGDEEPTRVAV